MWLTITSPMATARTPSRDGILRGGLLIRTWCSSSVSKDSSDHRGRKFRVGVAQRRRQSPREARSRPIARSPLLNRFPERVKAIAVMFRIEAQSRAVHVKQKFTLRFTQAYLRAA